MIYKYGTKKNKSHGEDNQITRSIHKRLLICWPTSQYVEKFTDMDHPVFVSHVNRPMKWYLSFFWCLALMFKCNLLFSEVTYFEIQFFLFFLFLPIGLVARRAENWSKPAHPGIDPWVELRDQARYLQQQLYDSHEMQSWLVAKSTEETKKWKSVWKEWRVKVSH